MNIVQYVHRLINEYTTTYVHQLTDKRNASCRSPNLSPARPTVASTSSLQANFNFMLLLPPPYSMPSPPSGPPPSAHQVVSAPARCQHPPCRASLHPLHRC
jgi:hypothetical protein